MTERPLLRQEAAIAEGDEATPAILAPPILATGDAMIELIAALFPICRSITGAGMRQSLAILGRHIPLEISEVASGTAILDWVVPKEWNIRAAHIDRLDGTRIVDFAANNLHVVQYSTPVDAVITLAELRRHLHTLPETPDWIPYRTSYYREDWGFCLAQRQLETLTDPAYRVVIDTTLGDGSLTYGECVVPGASDDEVLVSCHSCHPSLANDNLSGMAVATMLARQLRQSPRRFTYRFLFIPGTIGSITWLARNEALVPRIRHGIVLSCLGDRGGFTYKQSRRGNAPIDRIVEHALRHGGEPYRIAPFTPYGYDERQYCSPGFDLPVGCFMRSPNGGYPEYHTSADNLALLSPRSLAGSLAMVLRIVEIIEGDDRYLNRNPKGEPQLGRRGLYRSTGGHRDAGDENMALLWVLSLADGSHSLLDTAERAGLPFAAIRAAADRLIAADLLQALP
jgi:aminopeptidase-like protein